MELIDDIPDGLFLDEIIYNNQTFVILDYEANGSIIGIDFDFELVGFWSKRGSTRDYLLDFEIIDHKLFGTKKILHQSTGEWEKSKQIQIPYTGHFVAAIGDGWDSSLTVVEFLNATVSYEFFFLDGELVEIYNLDSFIEEWKEREKNGLTEKKEVFVQKHLHGAYNLTFGYGVEGTFFTCPDDFYDFVEENDEDTEDIPENTLENNDVSSIENSEQTKSDSKDESSDKTSQITSKSRSKFRIINKKRSRFTQIRGNRNSHIGNYFIDHSKTKINQKLAFLYSMKAARLGDELGIYDVGYCYLLGIGVKENKSQALKWFKLLAHSGSIVGCLAVEALCSDIDSELYNPKLGNHYLMFAARRGDATAMRKLGYNYWRGIGVSQNIEQSKYWYRKAIIHNNIDALYELGSLYSSSLKDEKSAFELYHLAAEEKHPAAANMLAFYYETGIGTDRNRLKAYDWYVEAANLGNKRAKERLTHLNPDGTENFYSY